MKTTIVPAQVTTVEDKITGNLGMSQMLLLVVPVFVGSLLFVVLPPFYEYSLYKIVLLAILAFLCITLAIRIRGKILLSWIVLTMRYNVRPRYFIYNKNDLHLRELENVEQVTDSESEASDERASIGYSAIDVHDAVTVEQLITNPEANFRLQVSKKGKLSVHLTEI